MMESNCLVFSENMRGEDLSSLFATAWEGLLSKE